MSRWAHYPRLNARKMPFLRHQNYHARTYQTEPRMMDVIPIVIEQSVRIYYILLISVYSASRVRMSALLTFFPDSFVNVLSCYMDRYAE